MEKATRKQRRIIKKLKLEKLVPLNVPPEQVDDKIVDLFLTEKINADTYATYHCSKAHQNHTYLPTVLGTLGNLCLTINDNNKKSKQLKKRKNLIKKLGFSELVPKELFSGGIHALDDHVVLLNIDGKIGISQYNSYYNIIHKESIVDRIREFYSIFLSI
jgi:hypothetical protein